MLDTKGFAIYSYPLGYQFDYNRDEDIVIREEYNWCFRDWDKWGYKDKDITYMVNLAIRVTRFEILPALIAARIMKILSAPPSLMTMLDEQLNELTLDDSPILYKTGLNGAKAVAGALMNLIHDVHIERLPKDKRMIFPKLFSFAYECPKLCYNRPFVNYYWPSEPFGRTIILTKDVIDWCMYSFEWYIQVTIGDQRCPESLSVADTKKFPDEPMPSNMKTAAVQLWRIQRTDIIHVHGHGLPYEDGAFLKYVSTGLSAILNVPLEPVEKDARKANHVSYRLGTMPYVYHTRCHRCSMTKDIRNVRFQVRLLA